MPPAKFAAGAPSYTMVGEIPYRDKASRKDGVAWPHADSHDEAASTMAIAAAIRRAFCVALLSIDGFDVGPRMRIIEKILAGAAMCDVPATQRTPILRRVAVARNSDHPDTYRRAGL